VPADAVEFEKSGMLPVRPVAWRLQKGQSGVFQW
jgi:hypothetical protein